MRKGETTISIPYFGCKRKGWRIKCGWKHKKISIPYWYPAWQDTLGWNDSDWIAFAGGKGTFSIYDRANPDEKIKLTGHHGDEGYFIWALENGINHKKTHEFNLNRNAGIIQNTDLYERYRSRENKYKEKHMDYGITFWK